MRIISPFHDYYDSAISFGIDKEILYIRDTKEIPLEKAYFPKFKNIDINFIGKNISINSGYVLFCGKIYKFLKLKKETNDFVQVFKYCYSFEDVKEFLNRYKLSFREDKKYYSWYSYIPFTEKGVKEYFQDNGKDFILEIFFKYNSPCMVVDYDIKKYSAFLNPNLKKLHFYNIKDSYTTFQDISMFIGGVLGRKTPQTIEIADKYMLIKKGFDDKSFKTISPGKKYNRRKIT